MGYSISKGRAVRKPRRHRDADFFVNHPVPRAGQQRRIAYLGDCYELSLGAQVALNGAALSGDRVAMIGLFEVYYDDIFPALGWNPM